MYYIGVDLGTSAVKLLLMEGSGKICNIVSKEYPLFFPHPGWSEQNPEDWFVQSMEGIKELTEGIDRKAADHVVSAHFQAQHPVEYIDKHTSQDGTEHAHQRAAAEIATHNAREGPHQHTSLVSDVSRPGALAVHAA